MTNLTQRLADTADLALWLLGATVVTGVVLTFPRAFINLRSWWRWNWRTIRRDWHRPWVRAHIKRRLRRLFV